MENRVRQIIFYKIILNFQINYAYIIVKSVDFELNQGGKKLNTHLRYACGATACNEPKLYKKYHRI